MLLNYDARCTGKNLALNFATVNNKSAFSILFYCVPSTLLSLSFIVIASKVLGTLYAQNITFDQRLCPGKQAAFEFVKIVRFV